MRWQLREFRIEPGRLDEFVGEWRTLVLPLRLAHGFSVLGPWVVPEEDRFFWILGHPDLDEADAAYYATRRLEPDPARLVVEVSSLDLADPRGARR